MKRYLIYKSFSGPLVSKEWPMVNEQGVPIPKPNKLGAGRIFEGEEPPTQEEMAALFAPVVNLIALAEAHIAKSFSTLILMDGLKRIMSATATDTLATIPKTIAVATWVETVKQTAIAGSSAFPEAPFTVAEVLAE